VIDIGASQSQWPSLTLISTLGRLHAKWPRRAKRLVVYLAALSLYEQMNIQARLRFLALAIWFSSIGAAHAFRNKFVRRTLSSPSSLGAQKRNPVVTFKNLEEMINSFDDELVLLAFTSGNCGPCKLQRLEWESLAKLDNSLKMLRIDMNQFPTTGSKFDIGKLPCTIIVKGKEVVLRADGLITAQELWDRLQLVLTHEHTAADDG
jgi:hypothetical protein